MKPLVVLMLLVGVLSAAPIPKSLKKAKPTLSGTWELVDMKRPNSKSVTQKTLYWIIDGEELTFERGGELEKGRRDTFKILNQDNELMQVDWVLLLNGERIKTFDCVATLSEDTLQLSAGDSVRPAKVEVTKDALLYTFKRIK
jgi:uncharacterized protein (TIGR03067 family)